MKRVSIRFRLWSAAAISVMIALAIAGIGLRALFEWHVERRVQAELAVDLNQLIGATGFGADGALTVQPVLTDPRFQTPLSGRYWQVRALAGGAVVRSRSLWDQQLDLPQDERDGALHVAEIAGPDAVGLIVAERRITDADGRGFVAAVAEDHAAVTLAVHDYLEQLVPALALLGLVLLAAFFVQISVGLAPLAALRDAVRDVARRRRARLDVAVPAEVLPLADEINRLLDGQERALARARTGATDLAHGLKTPLQVLAADIRTLRARGEGDLADAIGRSVAAIRRHVERELARVRIAPGPGVAACRIAAVARSVVDVVARMPRGDAIAFSIDIAETLAAPIDEGDLAEVFGNLCENAARFARTRVVIAAQAGPDGTLITIADDGPGIAAPDRAAALARGSRLDESGGAEVGTGTGLGSGTGLGLAIVADIVAAYGGTLTLGDAGPGLIVSVRLPSTDRE